MIIEVWMCDRCGRLDPGDNDGDDPPFSWFKLLVTRVGDGVPEQEALVCSQQCASILLRPNKKAPPIKPRVASPKPTRTKAGLFVCPECAATYARPQNLGRHRSRHHGVVPARRRKSA